MESDQSSDQSLDETNVWNEQNISLFDHQYCVVHKTKPTKILKNKKLNNGDNPQNINIEKDIVSVEIVSLDINNLDKITNEEKSKEENYSILTIEQHSPNTSLLLNSKDETYDEIDCHDIIKKHKIINKILDDQQRVRELEEINYMQDYVDNDTSIDILNTYNNKIKTELMNNDHPLDLLADEEISDYSDQDSNLQYNMKEIFKMLCAVPASKQKNNEPDNQLSDDISTSSNADYYEDFDLCSEYDTNKKANIIDQTNKNNFESKTSEGSIECSNVIKKNILNNENESMIYDIGCNDLVEELNHAISNMELDLPNDENENCNLSILNNKITPQKNTEIKKKIISKVSKRNTRPHSKKGKQTTSLAVLKTVNTVIDASMQVSNYDDTFIDSSNLKGKNRIESIKLLSFDDCIEGLINDVKKVENKKQINEPIIMKTQKNKSKRQSFKTSDNVLDNYSSKSLSCNICLANMTDHIELLNHLTEFHLEDMNMDTLKPDEYNIENDNNLVPINICDEFSIDNVIDIDESITTFKDLEKNLSIEDTNTLIFPHATYFCCICESIFKVKSNYDRHMDEVHIFNNKYNCHICKALFIHKGRLRRHLREKHQNYKPKAFNDSSPVIEVKELTNLNKPPTNEITDTIKSQIMQASAIKMKRYNFNKNKLKRNINQSNHIGSGIQSRKKNKHSKNKYKKNQRSRKINTNKEFTQNTLVHTFENIPQADGLSYVCKKCEIKFSSKEKLLLHDKSNHRTMKLYQVCLKCGDTFETYIKLLCHIKKDHKINLFKLFKCDLCPVAFKYEDKLSQHYKLKHNIHLDIELDSCAQLNGETCEAVSFVEAMHACCICKSLFTSKEMLGRHIESEHILSKDIKQKCEQCGQITSTC